MNANKYFIFNEQLMPSHWEWLLAERIRNSEFPTEKWVNCSRCPSKLNQYHHKARCCTFRPQIGNFLTGLALKNKALPETKFHELVKNGVFLPFATLEPPAHWLETAPPVVCHFWAEGLGCTIHKFRNGICSTFFCFTQGGDSIWTALSNYVMALETNLSWWILEKLGYNLESSLKLLHEIQIKAADNLHWEQKDLENIWGDYKGKELDFFLKAAELIESNKDSLYSIALNFLDTAPKEFQNTVAKYSADPTFDIPSPLSKETILELEEQIVDQVSQLQRPLKKMKLSTKARFELPSLPNWNNYYPDAYMILVLRNSDGEDVDFQPLSILEYESVKVACEASSKANTFIAGLEIRGFFN